MRAPHPRPNLLAMMLLLLLPALSLGQVAGQAASPPRFAVVSVVPVDPNQSAPPNPGGPFKPGGRFSQPAATIYSLLFEAYGLPAYRFDFRALPAWAKTARYAVGAKPSPNFPNLPPAENIRQIRSMLQTMLADRFHVRLHHLTKPSRVYVMTLAGAALKNATRGDPSQAGGIGSATGPGLVFLRGKNAAIAALASRIGMILGQPVLDHTGLSGVYNFTVRWQSPATNATRPDDGTCGPDCQSLLMAVARRCLSRTGIPCRQSKPGLRATIGSDPGKSGRATWRASGRPRPQIARQHRAGRFSRARSHRAARRQLTHYTSRRLFSP